MKTSVFGFIVLAVVFYFCLSDRSSSGPMGFFDGHAAIVVFGGVAGSLLIALSKSSLIFMGRSMIQNLLGLKSSDQTSLALRAEWREIEKACRVGQRSVLLNHREKTLHPEIRVACDLLINQAEVTAVQEQLTELRQQNLSRYEPVIEGWDLVARLAPSFGMVGTVTGMVQLFKNMASAGSNLGGAMGMALLATLYGIAFGAAIGGPMSTKMSNELNDRLNKIDLLEVSILALLHEFRRGDKK